MSVKLLGGPLHGREFHVLCDAPLWGFLTSEGGACYYKPLLPGVYCWDGWTLPAVLEWFAGKPAPPCMRVLGEHGVPGRDDCGKPSTRMACDVYLCPEHAEGCGITYQLPEPYSDPSVEFGRDVLVAFLRSGGWKHETAQGWADTIEAWARCDKNSGVVLPPLEIKRTVLRQFSFPVEDGGVGVRILVSKYIEGTPGWDDPRNMQEITPEQLLPPEPMRFPAMQIAWQPEPATVAEKGMPRWAGGLDVGKEPDRTAEVVAKKPKLKLLTTAESEALEKKPETWRDRPPLL